MIFNKLFIFKGSLILSSLCFIFTTACDSPLRNKVRYVDNKTPKTSQELEGSGDGVSSLQTQVLALTKYPIFLELQWLKQPIGNLSQTAELFVVSKNATGERISLPENTELGFYATMPSMGHAMEDAGYFEISKLGVHFNPHIRFNMPGPWKMELWLMDKDFNILDKVFWNEEIP